MGFSFKFRVFNFKLLTHNFSRHSELDNQRSGSYFLRSFEKFMAVKIRMKRVGAKNAPFFRIVVADGRSPRDGRFIEEIGTYQPLKKGGNFQLNLDRAKYWLSKGAQPSETVASFIKKAGKAAPAAA
jgi:small subunit ribosomal protein S16